MGSRDQVLPYQQFSCLSPNPDTMAYSNALDPHNKIYIWVVVKIMVPLWYLKYCGPYYNRYPKRDHNFDNHPYIYIHIYDYSTCERPRPVLKFVRRT